MELHQKFTGVHLEGAPIIQSKADLKTEKVVTVVEWNTMNL